MLGADKDDRRQHNTLLAGYVGAVCAPPDSGLFAPAYGIQYRLHQTFLPACRAVCEIRDEYETGQPE
jgi:hypothetical protein